MTLNKRQLWILGLILAVLILLTLFAAPSGSSLRQGSTYGRSPDGYGAWYAFMESRGSKIQRWQKPLGQLWNQGATATKDSTSASAPPERIILLRVSNGVDSLFRSSHQTSNDLDSQAIDWVERGNVLVLLGVRSPVTKAPFSSNLSSPTGPVRVETTRRATTTSDIQSLLSDASGTVVWQRAIGKGSVIYASTPFLAANAYQESPLRNFEFLATLMTKLGYPIWVDEYSHGYKDSDVLQKEAKGNLFGYLAQTPLLVIGTQAIVIVLVLIWGQNRRLGAALTPATPQVDNSQAYIQAMASVLRKAECSEFVVETTGKAEQLEIQKALGLGTERLEPTAIVDAWVQQTGRPAAELETVLNLARSPRRVREPDLLRWVEAIRSLRQHLPFPQRQSGS